MNIILLLYDSLCEYIQKTNYLIVSYKCLQCLLNFEAWRAAMGQDGGAYLKVKGIIPMKFQNILVFFLQITINNDHYGI